MDFALRELLINRICSGCVRINLNDKTYLLRRPTREQVYISSEIYFDILKQSEELGLLSEDEVLRYMIDNEFWDEAKQKMYEGLPKDIEEFKVALYKATFKSKERAIIRKNLGIAKSKFAELSKEREAYMHLSCLGAANSAKSRYLLAHSIYSKAGTPLFVEDDYWEDSSSIIEEIMVEFLQKKITDAQFRELARSEPWRSTWNMHKIEGELFGVPPCDYTDEQKALVNWSFLFDNIYQNPNCPNEDVLADDDMLDGWLILQRREQSKKAATPEEEAVSNSQIRNSDEVFVVAETVEDARKIVEGFNDTYGQALQKKKFEYLKTVGDREVNEAELPDVKQRLRMQHTQQLSQSMKGK